MKESTNALPPQVLKLAERERQVAIIIYERGAQTAKDIEALLVPKIGNAAVRSMLVRLVHKGILRRERAARGRAQQCVYLPSITSRDVKRRAIEQVSDRYFGGSLMQMMIEIFDLLERPGETTTGPAAPSGQRSNAQPPAHLNA